MSGSVVLATGGLELQLLTHGARVQRLWVSRGEGSRLNVALGHADEAGYREHPTTFLGATVGRYANRIGRARFTLDGVEHRLADNDGGATLHGGPDGWHARVWEVVDSSDTHCTFGYHSPDGEGGFPGAVDATVTYRVSASEAGQVVDIEHRATVEAPTLVAMTNHAYFNLDGEGSGSLDRHELWLDAAHYTPTDQRSIPLGAVEPVDGTPLDFREPRALGAAMRTPHPHLVHCRGIDHNLVLTPPAEGDDAVRASVRPVARLHSPDSGVTLTLSTDQPGLQVYTGNFFDGSIVGTSGLTYRQGDGIALEPQVFPDAPHHRHFPSAVVRPGDAYLARLRWAFST